MLTRNFHNHLLHSTWVTLPAKSIHRTFKRKSKENELIIFRLDKIQLLIQKMTSGIQAVLQK